MTHRACSMLFGLVFSACLGKNGDAGGETHWGAAWQHACVSDLTCGEGLSCIQHLCTLACEDDATCETNGGDATCVAVGADRICASPERVACDATSACDAASEGWMCITGARDGCTLPVTVCSAGAWEAGTLDTCRDTLSHADGPGAIAVDIGEPDGALDVLVVIDNSSSMNLEQRGASLAFHDFLGRLGADIDVRLAVTTPDVQCEANGTSIFAAKGRFNQHVWRTFPRAGQFHISAYCTGDPDCEVAACDELGLCDAAEHGQWACHEEVSDACIVNPNGTVNTYCSRLCTTDDECRERFGDPDFFCQKLSANPADWGCLLPPPTDGCPDELPPFLEGDDLALARCALTVGVNQEKCLKYEQGLEASRLALDPNGPNAAQVAAFMRPEAQLAVIYISDEDDCSVAEAIGEEHYETCALLPDTSTGGPLVPVSDYVTFLRALKPAGRVSVLASVGLADVADEADAQAAYDAYVASKADPKTCHHQTYLCQGPTGSSDWGRRYVALAEAFGADGAVDNLCHLEVGDLPTNAVAIGSDISPLERGYRNKLGPFADRVTANARRLCLPRAGTPTVTLMRGREDRMLATEAFRVEDGVADCPSGHALVPREPFLPGDRLRITMP